MSRCVSCAEIAWHRKFVSSPSSVRHKSAHHPFTMGCCLTCCTCGAGGCFCVGCLSACGVAAAAACLLQPCLTCRARAGIPKSLQPDTMTKNITAQTQAGFAAGGVGAGGAGGAGAGASAGSAGGAGGAGARASAGSDGVIRGQSPFRGPFAGLANNLAGGTCPRLCLCLCLCLCLFLFLLFLVPQPTPL